MRPNETKDPPDNKATRANPIGRQRGSGSVRTGGGGDLYSQRHGSDEGEG